MDAKSVQAPTKLLYFGGCAPISGHAFGTATPSKQLSIDSGAADSKHFFVFQSTQSQVCAMAGRLVKTALAATAEKSIPIDAMLKKVDKILRNELIYAKTRP